MNPQETVINLFAEKDDDEEVTISEALKTYIEAHDA